MIFGRGEISVGENNLVESRGVGIFGRENQLDNPYTHTSTHTRGSNRSDQQEVLLFPARSGRLRCSSLVWPPAVFVCATRFKQSSTIFALSPLKSQGEEDIFGREQFSVGKNNHCWTGSKNQGGGLIGEGNYPGINGILGAFRMHRAPNITGTNMFFVG